MTSRIVAGFLVSWNDIIDADQYFSSLVANLENLTRYVEDFNTESDFLSAYLLNPSTPDNYSNPDERLICLGVEMFTVDNINPESFSQVYPRVRQTWEFFANKPEISVYSFKI